MTAAQAGQWLQWHHASGLVSTTPGAGYTACNQHVSMHVNLTAGGRTFFWQASSAACICCLFKAQPMPLVCWLASSVRLWPDTHGASHG